MFSGRCQEMLLFFSHGNTRIGVQRVSLENKTQFILSSVNLKGLAKVRIIRSNHTFTYKTQRCTRQVITFAMGLAPSLFQATQKQFLVGGGAALGYCRFYPKLSAVWDTQGKDRFLVQLWVTEQQYYFAHAKGVLHQVHKTQRGFALPLEQLGWNPASTEVIEIIFLDRETWHSPSMPCMQL